MAKKEKERRYRKRRGGIAYTILAVLLIAASVVAACTVFFRVEEVTVEGNERYSQEQILSVASVEMGANMILTPGEQIAQRILGMMERLGMEDRVLAPILAETVLAAALQPDIGEEEIRILAERLR